MAGNRQEYEKVYFFMLLASYTALGLNLYYFGHPFFAAAGLSGKAVRGVMRFLAGGGFFRSTFTTKSWAYLLMILSHIVRTGKGRRTPWGVILPVLAAGTLLYFLYPLPGRDIVPGAYIITSLLGYAAGAWAVAMISRRLTGFKEAGNDRLESWRQCERLMDTPDSVNLPILYKWKGKMRRGWANCINPFRGTMILGTPGAGKSFSIFNPFIRQSVEKGYVAMCYDYKYPDLTKIIYNEYLLRYPPVRNPHREQGDGRPEWVKAPDAPSFFFINFNDPRRSHRCNPIHPSYIKDPADSAEIADIVMKNVAPGTVEKEDFFSMSAKVYLDCVINFLAIYKNGRYCTFPHVIELMSADYRKVFRILAGYPELETKIKPFAAALEAGAQDQLQGQIASATIPLNKMASPALYWVLSGDDFRLDLNNPGDPKFLCIGNDPDRQAIYGTALALFTSRIFKLINHKGKRKIMIFLDELPTIFIKGLDNLIATARSNKVAIVMGAQDKSQLVRDYSQKEADVIFNTVGNYFVGQVLGKTAEEMSRSFGREFREQQSQTLNIDSESIQRSFHQEEILPISTIETLSQGYFFGKTADNNDMVIDEKMFYGQVVIDVPGWLERRRHDQPIPVVTSFGDDEIRNLCHGKEMSERIIRSWCANSVLEKGVVEEDTSLEIEAMMKALSEKERERIIGAEVERMIQENVDREVRRKYEEIRADVRGIIEDELGPDTDEIEDEEEDYDPMMDLESQGVRRY